MKHSVRSLVISMWLTLTCTPSGLSQEVSVIPGDRYLSLLVGYNMWESQFLEVGLAKNQLNQVGKHPFGYTYFASAEMKLQGDVIVAPKVGVWYSNGIGFGLNVIYYSDFSHGRFCFRPEVGMGLSRFKLVYGYNISLGNGTLEGINTNNVSLMYLFTLKRVKDRGRPELM